MKANGKKPGEPSGSGGGNGQGRDGPTSSTTTSGSNAGGKAGAAAAKAINAAGGQKEESQGTQHEGGGSTDGPSSTTMANDGKGSGGSEVESNAAKNDKTAELLHEATQLLKTLRVPAGNPRLKVMQIGGLDQAGDGMVLLDSCATNGLRPARDQAEWDAAEPTHVQLANGGTDAFRLKRGTKILLGHPTEMSSWIVPTMTWTSILNGVMGVVDFMMMKVVISRSLWSMDVR